MGTPRPAPSSSPSARFLRSLHPSQIQIAIVPGNFSPYRSTRADAVGRWAAANKVELGFVAATDTRELRLLPPRLVVYFVLALWLFGGAPVVTRA